MKNKSEKVARATRDAVVKAAGTLEQLAHKTKKLAATAERKWVESQPRRQKAKKEFEKAARGAVAFGYEVRKGIKEGLTEVRKANKKK